MRIVDHERILYLETFEPKHRITIEIGEETLNDIRIHRNFPTGGLDMMKEFEQMYGMRVMEAIIIPLLERKKLV